MLKKICEFIQKDDKNSDIMDCYQEYLDDAMDRDTLVTICQRVLDEGREDLKEYPEYPTYTKWLGI